MQPKMFAAIPLRIWPDRVGHCARVTTMFDSVKVFAAIRSSFSSGLWLLFWPPLHCSVVVTSGYPLFFHASHRLSPPLCVVRKLPKKTTTTPLLLRFKLLLPFSFSFFPFLFLFLFVVVVVFLFIYISFVWC